MARAEIRRTSGTQEAMTPRMSSITAASIHRDTVVQVVDIMVKMAETQRATTAADTTEFCSKLNSGTHRTGTALFRRPCFILDFFEYLVRLCRSRAI
jgi:hypothetical protein